MAQPEVIVFSTANVDDVPMLSDSNVFTGTNTFNVLNGTIGTITTLASSTANITLGTINTIDSGTINSVLYKSGGSAGIDGTVVIVDSGTITHTLTFAKGILISYGTA